MNKADMALLHGAHSLMGYKMTHEEMHNENCGKNHDERNKSAWWKSDWEWVLREDLFEEGHLSEMYKLKRSQLGKEENVFFKITYTY